MWPWFSDQISRAHNGMAGWINAAIPSVPSSVSDACATMQSASAGAGPVMQLIPTGSIVAALAVVGLAVSAAVTIRLIRIAASFATAGGGA